jgi:predicted AAA+ superfamily ATPase
MYPRYLRQTLDAALADTPAVFVAGPRQAGKSTLVREVGGEPAYFTLDDANVLTAVRADAQGFLQSLRSRRIVVLDEVQRSPDLLIAVKREIDLDRRPRRFLMTGSANVMTMPGVSESLAGRVELLSLWPLAQCEIEARPTSFLGSLFSEETLDWSGSGTRIELLARALRGGFPEAVRRTDENRRNAWFGSYINAVVQREIKAITAIEDEAALIRVLRTIASRSGGPRNIQALAADTGTPNTTIQRYIALLKTTFLLAELPAWYRNVDARLVKTPKLLVTDSGLYSNLVQIHSQESRLGFLWESFVGAELLRLISFESSNRFTLMHFRTHKQHEVDFVIEEANGSVVGIEVKMAASVSAGDFSGLRALQTAAGEKFYRGIVLYSGERTLPFGPGLWAVPITALWS